MVSISWL